MTQYAVTTNQLTHVLTVLGYPDWAEAILDQHAASERHPLPDVDSDPTFGDPTSATYDQAILAARELLRETIRDPENEGHPEYTRGVVNLIAELWGKFEMDTSDRMEEVQREIFDGSYASELAALTARVALRYPDDEDAARAAEYAQQVIRDHS